MSNQKITNFKFIALFSSFQFIQIGMFSFFFAFLPLYLAELGFDSHDIALQNVATMIAMMIAGPLVLELTNENLPPNKIAKFLSVFSPAIYGVFLFCENFLPITFIWFIFMGTWIAAGILIDVELIKLSYLKTFKFERIRLWGSVGFIAIGFFLGFIIKQFGANTGTFVVIPFILLQSFALYYIASSLSLPEVSSAPKRAILKVIKDKNVFFLFAAIALCWTAHAPFYTYFSLYLERLSFSANEISLAWNLGVAAEILIFLIFSFFEKYFSLLFILRLSFIFASLRWLTLYLSQDSIFIYASQALHAFSFGTVYICATKLAYLYFPVGMKGKAQGYLSLFGIGLGSLLGRSILTMTGSLEDYLKVQHMFIGSTIISLLAYLASLMLKAPPQLEKEGDLKSTRLK